MTLSFSRFIGKQETWFVDKIIEGLMVNELIKPEQYNELVERHIQRGYTFHWVRKKIHTIRTDAKNRWKPGMDIHFVINNRSKNRYQFAPVLPVTSVQNIIISNQYIDIENGHLLHIVKEPGRAILVQDQVKNTWRFLNLDQIDVLALNDGFENTDSFFNYFCPKENTTTDVLKLIHWTDIKY